MVARSVRKLISSRSASDAVTTVIGTARGC
jgi:hypothetical protein